MLAMTRKILQWLRDNEAELQDVDYVDGVDNYCSRVLVYRRPDVWPKTETYHDVCRRRRRRHSSSADNGAWR